MNTIFLVIECGGIVKKAFLNEGQALEFKRNLEIEDGGYYFIKEVPYI